MVYSNKTHVILLHDEVSTSRVSLILNDFTEPEAKLVFFKRDDKEFEYDRCYPYNKSNIKVLTHPKVFDPHQYSVFYKEEKLDDVYVICKFRDVSDEYWTVSFVNEREDIVCKGEYIRLAPQKHQPKSTNPIDYLMAMAYFHGYDLRNKNNNDPLGSQYKRLMAQKEAPLLEAILNPEHFSIKADDTTEFIITPFGSNMSQLRALRQALSNRISVIQGPPGTGKTQTILNILANLVVNGKTVLVVAGSNSATENVYEKMQKYGLDFLIAKLGKRKNKTEFFRSQKIAVARDNSWNKKISTARIEQLTDELGQLYEKNVEMHRCIQEGKIETSSRFEQELNQSGFTQKSEELTRLSMDYYKSCLWDRYGKTKRNKYKIKDLGEERKCIQFLNDYPIVLSTAFSSKNNINPNVLFDYIILDESSQIDVTTGILAMSCAKSAVIVGDLQQLPHVVPSDIKYVTNFIFRFYDIPERFNYSENSLLHCICKSFNNLPETTLLEHYRCHPKIAKFFNDTFYGGKLVIMRRDNGEENVLSLRYTVPGNHAMNLRNNREEEEIEDFKSDYSITGKDGEEVGIIAPYNNQVSRIGDDDDIEKEIMVSTVHDFQGRERDSIIISTVDNTYSDFINDSHLINVAVSRAKNRLIVVTNHNEGNEGYMRQLVDYIQENGRVELGEIKSVFDLMYPGYERELEKYLHSHPAMPADWSVNNEPPSLAEKLYYGTLMMVLSDYPELSIEYEAVLDDYIPDDGYDMLSDEEKQYVAQPDTHIDFLILKKEKDVILPLLAIEVDGETYHIPGSRQYEKDCMKDRIVKEVCGIEMIRVRTKESINEIDRLREMLSKSLGDKQ